MCLIVINFLRPSPWRLSSSSIRKIVYLVASLEAQRRRKGAKGCFVVVDSLEVSVFGTASTVTCFITKVCYNDKYNTPSVFWHSFTDKHIF